ncbi:dCMP deaminase family protein [Candidatus Micrarchaeota archaeon]|nr:dCMP deaminase family protein [Candidatus Micrarchaeota archaeon]
MEQKYSERFRKPRVSWDEYFMKIAEIVSERTTCLRLRGGAVVVKDKRIIATGYNGSARGLPHCSQVGCLKDHLELKGIPRGTGHESCRAIHAEENAILQCALHGISSDGATMYATVSPCLACAKSIINAGIKRVVYRSDYDDDAAFALFKEAGVGIEKLEE